MRSELYFVLLRAGGTDHCCFVYMLSWISLYFLTLFHYVAPYEMSHTVSCGLMPKLVAAFRSFFMKMSSRSSERIPSSVEQAVTPSSVFLVPIRGEANPPEDSSRIGRALLGTRAGSFVQEKCGSGFSAFRSFSPGIPLQDS